MSVSPRNARVSTTSRGSPPSRVIWNLKSRPPLAHRRQRLGQLEPAVEAWARKRCRSEQELFVLGARRRRAQLVGMLVEEARVRIAGNEVGMSEHPLEERRIGDRAEQNRLAERLPR